MGEIVRERRRKPGLAPLTVTTFLFLLILPVLALQRIAEAAYFYHVLGYVLGLSVVAYLLYRGDKRRAQLGEWRVPESTLHVVELLGGWPGAFLAQRMLRHKNAKGRYQLKFWAIVAVHQLVLFEFLNHWTYSQRLLSPLFR